MDINLIFMTVLGLTLILLPLAIGARYLREWRSESHRLVRRMRELE